MYPDILTIFIPFALFPKQRVAIEDYLQCAGRVVSRFLNFSEMTEFIFLTEGSTVAAAAVSITRKVPLFASNIGNSESGSGTRAWLSGVLALPAAGLNKIYTCFKILSQLFGCSN